MKPIMRTYIRHQFGDSLLCPSQPHSLRQQHTVRRRNSSRLILNGLGPARWTSTSTACHPKTALFFPGTLHVYSQVAMTQSTDFISQAKVFNELAWPLPGSTSSREHANLFLKKWTPYSATPSPRSLPKARVPPSPQPKTRNQLSWPHQS